MDCFRDSAEQYPVKRSELIWEGSIFSLREDIVDLNNCTVKRQYLYHPGAVAIVAYREENGIGQVLLINQYRHPVRSKLWEIPAGLLDKPAEPWVKAAQRELAEEADLQATQWNVLVDFYTSPGASDESLRIYLARDLSEIPEGKFRYERVEEESEILVEWVDLQKAVDAILSGHMHNPSACMGILALDAVAKNGFRTLRDVNATWDIDRRNKHIS